MANIIIPTLYDSSSILIADDEPEHIEFLVDYLRAKGYSVIFAKYAQQAIDACEQSKYRAYFVDLNIPLGGWSPGTDPSETYNKYPGLHIIRAIRTQGNSGARVVAYSAHYNSEIDHEISKLYCKYLVKGRAKELKQAISDIMANDPLEKLAGHDETKDAL